MLGKWNYEVNFTSPAARVLCETVVFVCVDCSASMEVERECGYLLRRRPSPRVVALATALIILLRTEEACNLK